MSEREKLEPFIVHNSLDFENDPLLIDYLFLNIATIKSGTIQKQTRVLGDKVTCYNKPIASRMDLTEKAYANSQEALHYYGRKALTQTFITGYIVNFIDDKKFDDKLLAMIKKFYPDELALRCLDNSCIISSDSYDFISYYLIPENAVMLSEKASSWELETHLDRVVNKIGRKYATNI